MKIGDKIKYKKWHSDNAKDAQIVWEGENHFLVVYEAIKGVFGSDWIAKKGRLDDKNACSAEILLVNGKVANAS